MIKNKYTKLGKIKLVALVDKTLNKTLFKENIKFGFQVTSIQLLNLRTINDKLLPNEVDTIVNTNKTYTKFYNYNDEVNESLRRGKKACRRNKILKYIGEKTLQEIIFL